MTMPVLDISNLTISLPAGAQRPHAVEGASLSVNAGEIVCVVGESGSGKSMLAKAVMRLLPGRGIAVTDGSISLTGTNLLALDAPDMRALRGAGIAMVFQEPMTALNPLIRIGDQIAEVLEEHTDLDRTARRKRVLEILDDVHLPDPPAIARAYPHQLSGGQRQRAMIAMALILEPKLIIADEPTTALDVTTQAQILKLIAEIQQTHGTAVLFITHDFGVVAEIADHVAVMQFGKIVETGTRDQVLSAPQHPYTRDLIAAVPGLAAKSANEAAQDEPLLRASGLSKTFRSGGGLLGVGAREVHAVRDASLTLGRGETLGIIGESGSGKSTLARLLIRLIEADWGEVLIEGEDFLKLSPAALHDARRRIQMIFQDPFASLNPRHRVSQIIAQGMRVQGWSKAKAQARVAELLAVVGLDTAAGDRYPHEFSGGQRQRIGIARALAIEPEILIADEVVSALDVSIQSQVLDLLKDIQKRFGLSIIFITHDLCVAAQMCDRIMVMHRGTIVEMGPAADVLKAPQEDYTRKLLASVPGRGWLGEGRQISGQSDLLTVGALSAQ